jgi:hypothetical protein
MYVCTILQMPSAIVEDTHRIHDGGLLPVVLPVELVAVLAREGAPEALHDITQ